MYELITLKQTTSEVVELLRNYLPEDKARERANNIVQPIAMGDDIDHEIIYASLSPSTINEGISEPLARRQAAYEVAKILTVYRSDSLLAAWAGIQMLGFSAAESSEWMRSRGYLPNVLPKNVIQIDRHRRNPCRRF